MELQKSGNMRVKVAFIEIPVPNLKYVCCFFYVIFIVVILKK